MQGWEWETMCQPLPERKAGEEAADRSNCVYCLYQAESNIKQDKIQLLYEVIGHIVF